MARWGKISGTMKKLLTIALALCAFASVHADICIKNGEKLAFLGDSITAYGNGPAGYLNLVMKGLEVAGVKAEKVAAGVGGNKSNNMLDRVDRDILRKNVQWMTLSCGVNDVWHGANGVELEQYKKNISAILDKCAASNVTVIVMTASMIGEDAANANNVKLEAYNAWLREEAKRRNLRLADINAAMQAELARVRETDKTPGNKLTKDGVHMGFAGDCMMARCLLKAMGVEEAQMDAITAAWRKIPGAYTAWLPITVEDFEKIDAEEGTFDEALQRKFRKWMEE